MLHKFNTLVRLCLVAFLVIPLPVLGNETTTTTITEEFDENGWTSVISYDSGGASNAVTNVYAGTYLCYDYCLEYNQQSGSGYVLRLWWDRTDIHTFAVDLSGLNNDWDIKYLYTDDTDSGWIVNTFTPNQPENNPGWEDNEFTYTETSGKFIKEVNLNFYSDYVGLDNIAITYDNPVTTTTEAQVEEEEVVEETTTTQPPPPPPPPPPPTTTTTLYVVVNEDGSTSEYNQTEVEDGTVDRDNQRKANEDKYGCYMTDAQIDRGDCDIPEEEEEEVVEEKEEEVIIEEDEKEQPDTEEVISDYDVVVPEVVVDDEEKDPIDEPEEEVLEDELDQEIPGDDIFREDGVQEEDVKDQDNKEEEIKEEEEVEETEEILLEPEEESEEEPKQEFVQDPVELTEEEVAIEVAEVEEIVEDIKEVEVEDLETEQVIEVLTEVADVGVENLTEVSEDVLEVVSEVIEEVITIATEEVLTEEQVEVVQEVLNLEEPEDVQIIAEAVKEDEAVAEAVEEYVERAVVNADVEDYNLADVVTEIQTEEFLSDPVGAFTDIDIAAIDLTQLGDTMTSTQKEKAQEVVVPVIIASQIVASVQVVPVRIRRRV